MSSATTFVGLESILRKYLSLKFSGGNNAFLVPHDWVLPLADHSRIHGIQGDAEESTGGAAATAVAEEAPAAAEPIVSAAVAASEPAGDDAVDMDEGGKDASGLGALPAPADAADAVMASAVEEAVEAAPVEEAPELDFEEAEEQVCILHVIHRLQK